MGYYYFSEMAIMGGWEIFTRNGEGARNEGVGFIMGDGKILKSLYIVGRGVLTPLFYEDLLYCLFRLFQMLKKKFPVTFNPHLHCSFCCHVSLAEWVITPHLMCYFT